MKYFKVENIILIKDMKSDEPTLIKDLESLGKIVRLTNDTYTHTLYVTSDSTYDTVKNESYVTEINKVAIIPVYETNFPIKKKWKNDGRVLSDSELALANPEDIEDSPTISSIDEEINLKSKRVK